MNPPQIHGKMRKGRPSLQAIPLAVDELLTKRFPHLTRGAQFEKLRQLGIEGSDRWFYNVIQGGSVDAKKGMQLAELLGCELSAVFKQVASPARESNVPPQRHLTSNSIRFSGRRRRLVVGCFDYPPFIYAKPGVTVRNGMDCRDVFAGPWHYLTLQLAKELKLKIDMTNIHAATLLEDLAKPTYDLIPCLFRTRRREKYFDFSIPLYQIGLQVVCKSDMPAISKEDMVKGRYRIVVQPGEVGWEYATDELRRAMKRGIVSLVGTQSTHEALDMLKGGHYDLAIADEGSCQIFMRADGNSASYRFALGRPLRMYDACLAVRKELNWNIDDLNLRLTRLRNAKTFRMLEKRAMKNTPDIELCGLD
jgi:ABC-type amino acid transport substrate-binding protein